ncbi:MAG: DUF456 domain-containing protein [Dysgonamonadaceae bacterium]|jgi:uncharacterized protein YqgC (DUF456 family)|nr:DUF456 domain-containing protein [Dysgonamonadaceae bacterium]
MDVFLIIIGAICLVIGFLGCIVPFLPGPPISWVALLILKFTTQFRERISWELLWIWAAVVIVVLILDYIVPIWGTKKMGGSSLGAWGATFGMIAGLFFMPWGIILGPFLGALAGETLNGTNRQGTLKAAWGSVLGFFLSTGIKLIVCGLITANFIRAIL